ERRPADRRAQAIGGGEYSLWAWLANLPALGSQPMFRSRARRQEAATTSILLRDYRRALVRKPFLGRRAGLISHKGRGGLADVAAALGSREASSAGGRSSEKL